MRWLSIEPQLQRVDLREFLSTGWNPLEQRYRPLRSTPAHCVDWVVVGGESGPKARKFDPYWARLLRNQCQAAGVPIFIKQMGANVLDCVLDDQKGGNPEEWPRDLRVREFPRPTATATQP